MFLTTTLSGQNSTIQSWPSDEVHALELVLPFSNHVEIIGENRSSIQIEYLTEGEYKDDLRLKSTLQMEGLIVNELLSPGFNPQQDKLSAHKVMASSIRLRVPDFVRLSIQIENAKSILKGVSHALFLKQRYGSVLIASKAINGKVVTQGATIKIPHDKKKVFASSKKGKIEGINGVKEEADLFLQSNSGNISRLSDKNIYF